MSDRDNITLPRKHIDYAAHALEHLIKNYNGSESFKVLVSEIIHHLRKALAAEQPKHPGYVIGSHWLETAYSRICAGEAEADVLRDIGLVREEAFLTGVAQLKAENEALRRDAERLREELKEDTGVIAVWRGRTERAEAENERLREALEKVLAADDDPNDKLTYLRSQTRVVIFDALRREET